MVKSYLDLKKLIISKKISLLLKDGTFKTTKKNRFNNVLDLLSGEIRKDSKLNIFEIGPSYGFTSKDIFDYFNNKGIDVELKAYEKNLYVSFKEIFFRNFLIFQEEYLIGVYSNLLNRLIIMYPRRKNKLMRFLTKLIQGIWEIIFINNLVKIKGKKIKLLTDEINQKKIKITDNFRNLKINQFNVLICLNVLNYEYYNYQECKGYLREFCSLLKDKSYVLIGKNKNEIEYCSLYLYLKNHKKLTLIKNLNDGWDFEKKEIFL